MPLISRPSSTCSSCFRLSFMADRFNGGYSHEVQRESSETSGTAAEHKLGPTVAGGKLPSTNHVLTSAIPTQCRENRQRHRERQLNTNSDPPSLAALCHRLGENTWELQSITLQSDPFVGLTNHGFFALCSIAVRHRTIQCSRCRLMNFVQQSHPQHIVVDSASWSTPSLEDEWKPDPMTSCTLFSSFFTPVNSS